jgi:hypothetical protein
MHAAIETRNENFRRHRDSGDLTRQQRAIMTALHGEPDRDWTLQEIVKLTGLPVNVVSGRANELKSRKPFPYLLESTPRACSITKRTVTPLRINRGQLALELAA